MRPTTVGTAIEVLNRRFLDAGLVYGQGTDNSWDEAVWLVLSATGFADHPSSLTIDLTVDRWRYIEKLADRRIDERVPMAYLLGCIPFAGLSFFVERGVVVPRSPIAELIDTGFRPWLTRTPKHILDLCCGSGCIGLACAAQFVECEVTLVDRDPRAIALTQRNAQALGLSSRTTIVQSDLYTALAPALYDLIVCNPPYVDSADMANLPPEFNAEPASGLAAGEDGLDLIRGVVDELDAWLAPMGLFVGEVGNSAAAFTDYYAGVDADGLRRRMLIWPDLSVADSGVFLLESC